MIKLHFPPCKNLSTIAPVKPLEAPEPESFREYSTLPTPRISSIAVYGLVFGILSLISYGGTSLPAVVCGHISLSHIKRSCGALSGRGIAIAGLITGYMGFCFLFFITITMVDKFIVINSLSDAREIQLACYNYASDHGGHFPQKLEQLGPEYISDKRLLHCPMGLRLWPFSEDEPSIGFDYFGGKTTDPSDQVLLRSKARSRRHERIIYTLDGGTLKRD